MKMRIFLSTILVALLAATQGFPQDYTKELGQAAKYHKEYNFNKAVEIYNSMLASRPDSTLANRADSALNMKIHAALVQSENGKNLLKYAYTPALVTKKEFPASSFWLNYPGFENSTWIRPPAQYIKGGEQSGWNVMHFSPDKKIMVFSTRSEDGSWNIMQSLRLNDTLWSEPQTVNGNITTPGDEIFPHISSCGKKLYFASNGHSGMGGFDLFVSQWNEETGNWGTAQNLGFPFSSTGNDYFFYNTDCGNFTIFTSDREGKENYVTTYVTRHEVFPLKKEISQKDAPKYAVLEYGLPDNLTDTTTATDPEEEEDSLYTKTAARAHELEGRLQETIAALDRRRERYSATQDSLKRTAMEPDIHLLEKEVFSLNAKLGEVMAQLQSIELDLLAKGVTIKRPAQANTTAPAPASNIVLPEFAFVQNTMGKTPEFAFEIIEPALDLSFKIGKEAFIADLSQLPDGLVYHIQLMTTTRKATVKALKGFSPVFERKLASGKYTYSVGVFHKHADALKKLGTVRKNGFPTALITAYNKGKSLSTREARVLENQDNSIYRVTIAGYDVLPAEALAAIRENTTRDIAKANINGVMKYVIGPFTTRLQAEKLLNALAAKQVTNAEIEKLEER